MLNGNQLINMERRNVVISVVQDRSKLQTFPPTVFKMSTPPQIQPTAEKSVQTQELNGSTTVLLTNNSLAHFHSENAAAEVANTLVSMATGSQRTNHVKQVNLINVPAATTTTATTSLPILSLADYTTPRGVPTAMALASQAKLSPVKHEEVIDASDDNSMSTDDFHSSQNESNSSAKSRTKSTRKKLMDKAAKAAAAAEAIQYGPIVVKPRKTTAPTLANGRKSKDEPLPPDENLKRQQRRDRNRQAAAKCRRRRNELREVLEEDEKKLVEEQKLLERNVQTLTEQRNQLEVLLQRHLCLKKTRSSLPTSTTASSLNVSRTDLKSIPATSLLDPNNNNNHGNSKPVIINIANAQELFAVGSFARANLTNGVLSTSSSAGVPIITLHLGPELAQALFGSSSVDKTKLAELLQQPAVAATSTAAAAATAPPLTTTTTSIESSPTSESVVAHPSDSITTHPNSKC